MKIISIMILALTPVCLAQSPGEVVGTTYFDMQENGSGTNRIVIAPDGGVHVCWTKGTAFPRPRYEYYNYRYPEGNWMGSSAISDINGSGFGNIGLGPDDCIAIFYHAADQMDIYVSTSCGGYYDYLLPDTNSTWPKGAVSPDGRFHVIAARHQDYMEDRIIMYNTSDDFGETWPLWTRIDSIASMLWTINTSRISERTAIVEGIPVSQDPYPLDIGCIISENGVNWDISDWRMITDYGGSQTGAFIDVELIFDNSDYLHVIWNTFNTAGEDNSSTLWHWSEETDEISQIAYFGHVGCEPGTHNLALCKMSLGIDTDNNLFCVWTGFSSADASAGGYCNGDLYMSYSMDGGLIWADYQNITNSQTPGCPPGDCDSDNWASMAETVDENLRVFYVNDKDAGAAPVGEGEATNSPMLYLEIPNPTLTNIVEDITRPENFDILSAYPNPFNAKTTIKFSLSETAAIKLEIFDITGRLVRTLANSEFPAGENSVVWDAENSSSGVYFAKLSTPIGNTAKKLVLLK